MFYQLLQGESKLVHVAAKNGIMWILQNKLQTFTDLMEQYYKQNFTVFDILYYCEMSPTKLAKLKTQKTSNMQRNLLTSTCCSGRRRQKIQIFWRIWGQSCQHGRQQHHTYQRLTCLSLADISQHKLSLSEPWGYGWELEACRAVGRTCQIFGMWQWCCGRRIECKK